MASLISSSPHVGLITGRKGRSRGGCVMEAVEVRPRPHGNEVDANFGVDVRKLHDNKMWIGKRSTSSPPDTNPSKRRHNKKPAVSACDHQKSWWKDPEIKRKHRVARYELYASRARLKSSLQAAIRFFKL